MSEMRKPSSLSSGLQKMRILQRKRNREYDEESGKEEKEIILEWLPAPISIKINIF